MQMRSAWARGSSLSSLERPRARRGRAGRDILGSPVSHGAHGVGHLSTVLVPFSVRIHGVRAGAECVRVHRVKPDSRGAVGAVRGAALCPVCCDAPMGRESAERAVYGRQNCGVHVATSRARDTTRTR